MNTYERKNKGTITLDSICCASRPGGHQLDLRDSRGRAGAPHCPHASGQVFVPREREELEHPHQPVQPTQPGGKRTQTRRVWETQRGTHAWFFIVDDSTRASR